MNVSWLYGLPAFLFFLLVILFFGAFSVIGFLLVRKKVERWLGKPPAQNEVISYYIAATGVVYGITLGLIAVGVWENFIHIQIKVEEEAATLSAVSSVALKLSSVATGASLTGVTVRLTVATSETTAPSDAR